MADYHDYVIKDGIFIGKFEEMYKDCENPWFQKDEKIVNALYRDCAIRIMKDLGVNSIVEFGCGLGYYTNKIHKDLGVKITGVDVSATAINKAKERFRGEPIDFIVDSVVNIERYTDYDCFLFADIMWYIIEDLDVVLDKMKGLKGKLFVNNMPFYKGNQKYGLDKFTNIYEFIEYIPFEYMGHILLDLHYLRPDSVETVSFFRI